MIRLEVHIVPKVEESDWRVLGIRMLEASDISAPGGHYWHLHTYFISFILSRLDEANCWRPCFQRVPLMIFSNKRILPSLSPLGVSNMWCFLIVLRNHLASKACQRVTAFTNHDLEGLLYWASTLFSMTVLLRRGTIFILSDRGPFWQSPSHHLWTSCARTFRWLWKMWCYSVRNRQLGSDASLDAVVELSEIQCCVCDLLDPFVPYSTAIFAVYTDRISGFTNVITYADLKPYFIDLYCIQVG